MKKKRFLLLLILVIIAGIVNSCKSDNQSPIHALFTTGTWQLASVTRTYFTGNTIDSTKKLDTACTLSQFFTFNSNGTCTYTNFDCVAQPVASGKWSLTANQLYLVSDIVCKDSTKAGSSSPFTNAEIYNLGQYSLVLITGDVQPNYSLTKQRQQVQYGFIRQKTQ